MIYRFKTITVKIKAAFFIETDQLILNSYRDPKILE